MRARPAVLLVMPALLALAPLAAAWAAATDQAIVLDRPERVGALSTISASCRSDQQRSIQLDERPAQAQHVDLSVEFAGEREVLAVGAQGQPTRLRLTVARLVRTVAGKPPLVMLPAGTLLLADCDGGQARFRRDDAVEMPDPVAQALRLVLDLGDGTAYQDQAFGSAQRRAPGEQWAINPKPAARLLADLRLVVDPSTLSGSAAFSELLPGSDHQQLRFTAALAFSDFTVPALPASLTVTRATGTLALDRLYPLDPALPMDAEKRTLTESLSAQGESMLSGNLHAMTITIDLEQRNELHLTPHAASAH